MTNFTQVITNRLPIGWIDNDHLYRKKQVLLFQNLSTDAHKFYLVRQTQLFNKYLHNRVISEQTSDLGMVIKLLHALETDFLHKYK